MKLKNLLKQLQEIVDSQPKLNEYVVKFREEVGQSEDITHVHTEGRVLVLSSVWASDQLNPPVGSGIKVDAKLRKKIVPFLTDAEMALKEATEPKA